jgi:hypothetical protein
MTPEQAEALRKPFPAEVVGKLPKVNCKGCVDANKRGGVTCEKHVKAKCRICNGWISTQHIHLDFVGHAEVTDRFLQVDPEWTWEPMAFAPNGLPQLDEYGGLWIKLTISGTTKPGYGAADGKKGPDAVKETIGDALRNAGMRFGVALDLWGAKFKGDDDSDGGQDSGEVHGRGASDAWEDAQPARPVRQQPAPAAPLPTREEVIAKAQQAITGATLAAIEPIRTQVQIRLTEKVINDADALDLFNAVNAKETALKKAEIAADPNVAPDVPTPDAPKPAGAGIVDAQRGRMQALFRDLGMADRAKQMEFIRKVTRREMESRNDLTAAEAVNVLGALESQKKMGAGRTDRHLTAVNGSGS